MGDKENKVQTSIRLDRDLRERVAKKLDETKYRPRPVGQPRETFESIVHEALESWLAGDDKMAIDLPEKIRYNSEPDGIWHAMLDRILASGERGSLQAVLEAFDRRAEASSHVPSDDQPKATGGLPGNKAAIRGGKRKPAKPA